MLWDVQREHPGVQHSRPVPYSGHAYRHAVAGHACVDMG